MTSWVYRVLRRLPSCRRRRSTSPSSSPSSSSSSTVVEQTPQPQEEAVDAAAASEEARQAPPASSVEPRFILRVAMGAGASADQGHILIASNGTGDLILINGPIAGAAFAGLVDPRAGFSAALADQGRVGPPPTSQAALAKLPVVRVSADDLAQDENAACCVCLEKHSVGDPVLRLPCGHLYHEACAMSWLKEHCTCPNCRYELPTDDADYEAGRKARMRHRRPRYRLGELMDLSVHHLRDLLRDAEVDASRLRGVCEKRDLVRCVIDTKAVDLVADPLPLALDVDVMRNEWSVKQLHDLAARVGVDVAGLDSTEMIDVLLDSGKIIPA